MFIEKIKYAYRVFQSYKYVNRTGLAFVLIAKNEAPYIEEWINFHVKQGVSHFFIYDNESEDNLHDVLEPYIESGLVTYELIPGRVRQLDAYNTAAYKYGHKFKYMGFIDADEFVFVRENSNGDYNLYNFVDNFMTTHKNAGGLAINWLVFGSNGHVQKPEGGVLENYTKCADRYFIANQHIKTICDPLKILRFQNPHFPIFCKGFHNLDEDGNVINGPFNQNINFKKIRINHYFTKSQDEYIQKMQRGCAYNPNLRNMQDFYKHDQNYVTDTEILSRV